MSVAMAGVTTSVWYRSFGYRSKYSWAKFLAAVRSWVNFSRMSGVLQRHEQPIGLSTLLEWLSPKHAGERCAAKRCANTRSRITSHLSRGLPHSSRACPIALCGGLGSVQGAVIAAILRCRVGCHVDPDELSAIKPHDDEAIQQLKANGRHYKNSMAAMSGAWLRRKVLDLEARVA
jgi:hypothetical protein